jgi:hypothetical protein
VRALTVKCTLLLCCLCAAVAQRQLQGWSLKTRLSDTADGHVLANPKPQPGSCVNGTMIRSLETTSLVDCELQCGYTADCRWYAYCASHVDVALPVQHFAIMHQCGDLRDVTGKEEMSAFGRKKDKCVLFSQCLRVDLNINGSVPYVGFYIYEYAARGVMTGLHAALPLFVCAAHVVFVRVVRATRY